jgi:hypothetical protein
VNSISVQVEATPSLLDVSEMYRPEERFKEKAAFRDYTKVFMATDYTDKKENEISSYIGISCKVKYEEGLPNI